MKEKICNISVENLLNEYDFLNKVMRHVLENNIKYNIDNYNKILEIRDIYISQHINTLISKTHVSNKFTPDLKNILIALVKEDLWDGNDIKKIVRYMLDIVSPDTQLNNQLMMIVCMERYIEQYINTSLERRRFKVNDVSNFIITVSECDGNTVRNTIESSKILTNNKTVSIEELQDIISRVLFEDPNGKIVGGIFYGFSRPTFSETLSSVYDNFYKYEKLKFLINRKLRYIHFIYGVNTYFDFEETGEEHALDVEEEKKTWEKLCSQTYKEPEKNSCKFVNLPVLDFTNPTKEQIITVLSSLINCQDTKKCPLVSGHCSAGYGRTGLIVLAILKCIYKTKTFEETLSVLREKYNEQSYYEVHDMYEEFEAGKIFLEENNIPDEDNKLTNNYSGNVDRWNRYLDMVADKILSEPICVELQERYSSRLGDGKYELELKDIQNYSEYQIKNFKIFTYYDIGNSSIIFRTVERMFAQTPSEIYDNITSRNVLNAKLAEHKKTDIYMDHLYEEEKNELMMMLFMQRYLTYYLRYCEDNNLTKFSRDSIIEFYVELQTFKDNEQEIRTFIEGKINEIKSLEGVYILDIDNVIKILCYLWEMPSNMKNVDNIFVGMPEQEIDDNSEFKLIKNMRYLRDIYGVEKYFNFREPSYEDIIERDIWGKLCSQQNLIGVTTTCKYLRIPLKDFHPPSRYQIELFLREISDGCERGCSMSAGHCVGGNGRTGAFILAILKCKYDIDNSEALIELLTTKYTLSSSNEIKEILSIPDSVEWREYVKYLFDEILSNENCIKIKKYNIDNI